MASPKPDLYSISDTSTILLEPCTLKDKSQAVKIQLYIPLSLISRQAKEESSKELVQSRNRLFIPLCHVNGLIQALTDIRQQNPGNFIETNYFEVSDICPPGKSVKHISGLIQQGQPRQVG